MSDESKPKQIHAQPTLSYFWRHARRYPRYLWAVGITVPITVLIGDFLLPYITSQILKRLSDGQYDHVHIWNTFSIDLLIYAGGSILTGVVGWRIAIYFIWQLENNVVRDITQETFVHLLAMSPAFHANRFGGSLVNQTNKLAGAFVRLLDPIVYNIVPLALAVCATIIILAPRSLLYVIILIAVTIVYLSGTTYFSGDVRRANALESSAQSRQTGYLADAIANIFAIKTFAAAAAEHDRFWKVGTDVVHAAERSMRTTIKRQNYAASLTQTLSIAALVVAVAGVGQFGGRIDTIFLMVTFTSLLSHELWNFQSTLRNINRSLGDAQDMIEILAIEPEIRDSDQPERSQIKNGAIQFAAATFTHGDANEPLFENFNLELKPGERIGLVGHSGSGKTTLTRLLLRFSDLDSGKILIDGQDITHITQDDLRRAISYVPQEPLLFHRTLRENISYGKPKATQHEIVEAAQRAHAHEFIDRLPHGYDTLVGERGIKLSGGQRQRIAIARAMLKSAPILVLDEATSALDSESEKLIQAALWRLMEGRTAIVVAHRLSTIQRLDRIVVLEDGRIAEQGTHTQLLSHGGTYAKLWSHQSGGFIEED